MRVKNWQAGEQSMSELTDDLVAKMVLALERDELRLPTLPELALQVRDGKF